MCHWREVLCVAVSLPAVVGVVFRAVVCVYLAVRLQFLPDGDVMDTNQSRLFIPSA
jgi:hypothetical protein